MSRRSFGDEPLPDEQQHALRRAIRLEWATIAYLVTTVTLVYLVMGSSQAMKVAWIEDLLGFVPPLAFLVAVRRAQRPPSRQFPFGHHRSVAAGHLAASVALLGMGLFLIYDSGTGLLRGEHPPIGTMTLLGHTIWAGWPMVAVMVYAAIGPVVLGRMKLRVAPVLHDKVLYADADMNKADWTTALAAIVGVLGIGIGWWWADAVAALVISVSVVKDGWVNLDHAVRDLLDARVRTFDDGEVHPLLPAVQDHLDGVDWIRSSGVRMRDLGHVMQAEVFVVPHHADGLRIDRLEQLRQDVHDLDWKLQDVVVVPVSHVPDIARQDDVRPSTTEAR